MRALLLAVGVLLGGTGGLIVEHHHIYHQAEKVCAYGRTPATRSHLFCWVELP